MKWWKSNVRRRDSSEEVERTGEREGGRRICICIDGPPQPGGSGGGGAPRVVVVVVSCHTKKF